MHACMHVCMYVYIVSFVDVMRSYAPIIFHSCSISPVGEVPSTAPVNPLYKFDTAQEGEMFYFAVSR